MRRTQKLPRFSRICAILFLFISFSGCTRLNPTKDGTLPISHQIFDSLLKVHVDSVGLVDYEGFLGDREKLTLYLDLLSINAPNENWSREAQLAYWINAYNAFTIDLILQHYPLESIKDIGLGIQIPFLNTPWDIKFIQIAGEVYDLNNLEHNILRKNWKEPRIHFAINCASMSCPKLRNEAYSEEKLELQLEDQTRQFLSDPFRNEITPRRASLSKIFKWFSGDFTPNGSLIDFINRYSSTSIGSNTEIEFKEYDWLLNAQHQSK